MKVRGSARYWKISGADKRWFARHPERSYRLRLSGEAELKTFAAGGMPLPPLRPGFRYWAAIRKISSKRRIKITVAFDRTVDLDVSEAIAKQVYDDTVASNAELALKEPLAVEALRSAEGTR